MTSIRLDTYVVDTLMQDLVAHDRSPASFLVFLFLWRRTRGRRPPRVRASLREIAEGTGLARRTVQSALRRLEKRLLVSVHRKGITEVPGYQVHAPWNRGRRP